MNAILQMIVPFLLGAVALILFLGLINMLRGGDSKRSQMLMRWRVGLQLLAVLAAVAIVLLSR